MVGRSDSTHLYVTFFGDDCVMSSELHPPDGNANPGLLMSCRHIQDEVRYTSS